MGLGHVRAAFPLRHMAKGGVILYGSPAATPPAEYRIWRKIKRLYYVVSRAGNLPVIGKYILAPMLAMQKIEPYYPRTDLSKPNLGVFYLDYLIRKKRIGQALIHTIRQTRIPVIHTFYATAIALERLGLTDRPNYLLICDADMNRIWVSKHPRSSEIVYLAPCTQVKNRLLSYGVRPEKILITGFPLPKENIGEAASMHILKADLYGRLLRLDPTGKFFSYHRKSVQFWLNRRGAPAIRDRAFQLTFAVGGAGAQVEMVEILLKSLKGKIITGKIKIGLSAGIDLRVYKKIEHIINALRLSEFLGRSIEIVYHSDVREYMVAFNRMLRRTDVLWTKPSELSFFCALGIPILLAPAIGTHEALNRRWLHEIHAGIDPPGAVEYVHEWLFDLRRNGRLAEAAWDGFLKARKLGVYKIEALIATGRFHDGETPLEQ